MSSPPVSAETSARLQIIQSKIADGTVTMEEYREVITALRGDRQMAQASSTSVKSSRAAATKKKPDAGQLFDELENL